jgi:hypothetical protein
MGPSGTQFAGFTLYMVTIIEIYSVKPFEWGYGQQLWNRGARAGPAADDWAIVDAVRVPSAGPDRPGAVKRP